MNWFAVLHNKCKNLMIILCINRPYPFMVADGVTGGLLAYISIAMAVL